MKLHSPGLAHGPSRARRRRRQQQQQPLRVSAGPPASPPFPHDPPPRFSAAQEALHALCAQPHGPSMRAACALACSPPPAARATLLSLAALAALAAACAFGDAAAGAAGRAGSALMLALVPALWHDVARRSAHGEHRLLAVDATAAGGQLLLGLTGLGLLVAPLPGVRALLLAVSLPCCAAAWLCRLMLGGALWAEHHAVVCACNAEGLRLAAASLRARVLDAAACGAPPAPPAPAGVGAAAAPRQQPAPAAAGPEAAAAEPRRRQRPLASLAAAGWQRAAAASRCLRLRAWRRAGAAAAAADWALCGCAAVALALAGGTGPAAAAAAAAAARLLGCAVLACDAARAALRAGHNLCAAGAPPAAGWPRLLLPCGCASTLSAAALAVDAAAALALATALLLASPPAAGGGHGPAAAAAAAVSVAVLLRAARLAASLALSLACAAALHMPPHAPHPWDRGAGGGGGDAAAAAAGGAAAALARLMADCGGGGGGGGARAGAQPAAAAAAAAAEPGVAAAAAATAAAAAAAAARPQPPQPRGGAPAADPPAVPPPVPGGGGGGGLSFGLDAFSSLALAGLRGHLRGDAAAAALARLVAEADANADGAVTLAEARGWAGREPRDGGGVPWRAAVRRVLLGSLSTRPAGGGGGGGDAAAAGAAAAAAAAAADPLPPPPPQQQQQPQQQLLPHQLPAEGEGAAPAPPRPVWGDDAVGVPAGAAHRPVPRRHGLRLLSLEGGGIKGLAHVWQLQELERLTGRPIWDLFDLIGGTSTGGIVALAIVHRVPLADLEALYRTVAAEVFAPGAGWGGALRQLAAGYRCEAGPLLTILRARFGEAAPMRGGARPRPAAFVCATSQDGAGRLELRILRTYDSPSASRGRDAGEGWRVWEACAATSAAPTLLPLFARADGSVWVDGALSGSNNPSLLVATEGLEFAAGAPVDTFLSLGCGDVGAPSGPAGATSNAGLLFWLNQALSLAFDSRVAEDRTRRLLEQASPRTRRVRLSPSPLAFALSEHRPAALAAMKAEVLAHLRARGGELRDLAAALRNDEGAPQPTAGAGEGEGKAPPPAQAAAALADGSAALPHEQLTAYQLL